MAKSTQTIQTDASTWTRVQVPYYSVVKVQNGTTDKNIIVNCALGATAPTYLDSGFRASDNKILDFLIGADTLWIKSSARTSVTVQYFPIIRKNGMGVQMSVFETIRNREHFLVNVPAAHTFYIQNLSPAKITISGNTSIANSDGITLRQYEYYSVDTGQETMFSINGSPDSSFTYSIINAFNSDSICGPKGPQGNEGKSAFDISVENGFTGTVDEWLEIVMGPGELRKFSPKTVDVPVTTDTENRIGGAFVIIRDKDLLYPLSDNSEFSFRVSVNNITDKSLKMYAKVEALQQQVPITTGGGRHMTAEDFPTGLVSSARLLIFKTDDGTISGKLIILNAIDTFETNHTITTNELSEMLENIFN